MQQPGVNEWIVRCAQRLGDQWRNLDPVLLEEVAVDLLREPQMRVLEPEVAAVCWLRQGGLGRNEPCESSRAT